MPPPPGIDAAFLRPILARPRDDAPRLVWADFLDESDDPADRARAELVRVQCALGRVPAGHPRYPDLVRRQGDLVAAHYAAWAGELGELCDGVEFRRGLLDSVIVSAATFCTHAAALFRLAPVAKVRVTEVGVLADALADSPHLGRVRELDLCGADLGGGVAVLMQSPHLAGLRHLDLSFTNVGDDGVAAVCRAGLPRLRTLSVGGNQAVTDRGAELLAAADWFARLRSLDVSDNRLGPAGVARLARGPALHTLKVAANPVGDAGVAAFVGGALVGRVAARSKALDFRYTGVGPAGIAAVAACPAAAAVTTLDLSHNPVGDDGVAALCAGHFDKLTRLSLAKTGLTDRGARHLAGSHLMAKLTHLDAAHNRLTRAGVDALWAARGGFRAVLDTTNNFAHPATGPAELAADVTRVLGRLAGPVPGGR